MTEADVDLIRGGFDTFAEDGLDAILRLMDPEIEILTPANPDMQRGVGHDGVRRSLNSMLEMFEDWSVEALEFDDLGDDIVVSVCQYARGRGSGVTLESKSAWLFTMRNGKAIRLALFRDKKEAIASVQDQSLRQ
jgi:ketosteroid isomerase-like protein